jgi:hypothetical protein
MLFYTRRGGLKERVLPSLRMTIYCCSIAFQSSSQTNVFLVDRTGRLGGCAFICTHRFGARAGEPSSLDAPSDKRLTLIRVSGPGDACNLPRGDTRGEHSPSDRRDGALGAVLVFSLVQAESQRVSQQPAASFFPSPPLWEGGKFLSKTNCFSLVPNKRLFFFFLSGVLVLSNQLRIKFTPGGARSTEPPRFDSMITFWSSLGTLVSLMMGAGNLPYDGIRDLMMGIGVGVAIGT